MNKTFRPRPANPDEAGFLGIGTGKRVKAKAEAEAQILQAKKEKELALLESQRISFQQQATEAGKGYNPVTAAATAAVKLEETKQGSEKTLYIILGFVVVAVMVALYFIKKKQ